HILAALALTAVTAATTAAQSATPMPRNDATLSVGWLGAKYPGLEAYTRWHKSLFAGAAAGHYWSDHAKSEVEAAWLSRVNVDSYETELFPEGTAHLRTSYRFQDLKLSLVQVYQFGENAWVHPYVGGGIDI